jgi:hypothetical protein
MKSLSRSAGTCTSSIPGGVGFSNRHSAVRDQSLVGLKRPNGQSLIRARRHIIEFDSGLLIRHLDLRLTPGS